MQDELNQKMVAIVIDGGKKGFHLTGKVLAEALNKLGQDSTSQDKTKHGKQSMKELMKGNASLTNIEITDKNIKSFDSVARKYDIDYALKLDKTLDPPRYYVFFKAKDEQVMSKAFDEYSQKYLKDKDKEKPSVLKRLHKKQREATMDKNRQLEKTKKKIREDVL